MTTNARGAASRAENNSAVEKGARLGYAANGLIHLVIAWIALQLAWGGGGGGGEASASGALRTLAGTPFGSVLLWVMFCGFVLLGLWQVLQAFLGRETKDRIKGAAKAVVYLVLAFTTFGIVSGSGSSGGSGGSDQATTATATLMQQPFGRILVAAVGLGIAAVGVYHIYKGWKKKFLEDLREHPGTWVVRAGRAGYITRGIALILVGALFVGAALASDAQQAAGLDGALQTVRQAPYGVVLLTLAALGFAAYGVYSFGRAKYARI